MSRPSPRPGARCSLCRSFLAGVLLVLAACGGGGGSSEKPTPPPAPTGLVATAADAQVTLSWTAAQGAAGYRVYRSITPGTGRQQIASPTTTGHVDTGLANGTTYYYVVRATNAGGEGLASEEASAKPVAAITAPATPADLTAAAGNAQVQLSWSASTGATSYEVFRSPACSGTYVSIATSTLTQHTDTGLTNGTEYCYQVKARNAAGSSPASTTASATPTAPPPANAPPTPTGIQAAAANGHVTLTWNASATAASYLVRRSTTEGGTYADVGTPTATTVDDATVVNGTTYWYVVLARNAAGDSAPSAPVSARPGAEICVSNELTHTITVYDPSQSGDVAPLRILGNVAGLDEIRDVAFDHVNDEVWVANVGSLPYWLVLPTDAGRPVVVHARTATGNPAPVRYLAGPATGLRDATAIAVDAVNDEVFVSSRGAISVFDRTASGDVAPKRKLSVCTNCELGGVAVDPVHGELFMAVPSGATLVTGSTLTSGRVLVHTLDSRDGALNVLRSFAEFDGYAGDYVSIAYDATNDEIVVGGAHSVAFVDRTVSGTPWAKRAITMGWPSGTTSNTRIAVDAVTSELYVADPTVGVSVFPRTASGAATPSRLISGPTAGFAKAHAVAVDAKAAEVYVGDQATRTVAVHRAEATGDVAPVRTISGAAGGLLYPGAVSAAGGKLFVVNRGIVRDGASLASFSTPWPGSPTPATLVAGPNPFIGIPDAIAADGAAGEVFVADGAVAVFPFDATGDASRLRALPSAGSSATSVAIDSGRGEVLVGYEDRAVRAFSRTATGTTAPLWRIGPTLAWKPVALTFDPAHDEVVGLGWNTNGQLELFVHPRAPANSLPIRHIAGPAALLTGANGIVVDTVADEYLVSFADGAIRAYPRAGNGAVAPLRAISGSKTLLSQPSGIALCR